MTNINLMTNIFVFDFQFQLLYLCTIFVFDFQIQLKLENFATNKSIF